MTLIRNRDNNLILVEDALVAISSNPDCIVYIIWKKVSQILSDLHIKYDIEKLKELIEVTIPPQCSIWT